jgi:hypothetical protein
MIGTNRDYYLEMAINAVIEYVKKKEGIEYEGEDRLQYKSILKNDEYFHVFACFNYSLIIDYDSNTDELEINEVKDASGRRYTKDELAFIKSCVDRFGSLKEFHKAYNKFKAQHTNINDIRELNKNLEKNLVFLR